jgi:hypothetical protein
MIQEIETIKLVLIKMSDAPNGIIQIDRVPMEYAIQNIENEKYLKHNGTYVDDQLI